MPVLTKKSPKHRRCSLFISHTLVLFIILALFIGFFSAAQDSKVIVSLDQNFQVADFTVDKDITIHLTGNFTSENFVGHAYFGIYAPEGWVATISVDDAPMTPGASINFTGEVSPSKEALQKEHNIYVWASTDKKNPSFTEIMDSPSISRASAIIEIIKNRVKLICDVLEQQILPDSSITYSFSVSNIGTVSDIFFIDILNDERWEGLGWIITQSAENLSLESKETRTFYIEQQVPENAKEGDYDIEVVVSSSGDVASKESSTLVTKVRVPKITEPFWTIGLILMIAFIGTGIGLAAFFAATEYGYLAFLSLFLPLYVRLKKKDVLSHFTRGQIFGYIQANPGAHYNAIIQDIGLQNGVGAYHLKVLEREGFIKSAKEGIYKRFYPANMRIPEKRLHLSRIQRDVLLVIQKHPGVTQKEISKLLDESKQVVNYNVKVLETARLIRVERVGRGTACFAGNVRYIPDEDVYELTDEKGTAQVMNI